jgi:hypothetical protein
MSTNDYNLTLTALRKILRAFQKFNPREIETATILLDLRNALGDNPMVAPAITPRQRQVIQQHLIEDRSHHDAAKLLNINPRTMRYIEEAALKAILAYLKGEVSPYRIRQWRPWQIALLYDGKLTLPELATKIGKSELAIKVMMCRIRKQNEAVPYRRRPSRRTAT